MIKEQNWSGSMQGRLRVYRYSDSRLNSDDQYLNLDGRYQAERHIFSLNAKYDLDSTLNALSDDFGLVGQRVNRKIQSITPQYTFLITERAALQAAYSYSDVDYLDAGNTGFTPYIAQTGTVSLIYNLSERDKLTATTQYVDYHSRNNLVTYTLISPRMGIEHNWNERITLDLQAGVSRRNSTNLVTQSFDFFGNIITQTREVDFSDRGFVLDAGYKETFERGELETRLSRDNTTNSFGGLNRVDTFKVNYLHHFSETWWGSVNGKLEDVNAISSGTRSTDRTVFYLNFLTRYKLSRKWSLTASYRYIQRKFKNTGASQKAPHSNRIYLGMTYNFPDITTF